MAATASVPAVPAPAGRSRWTRLIPSADRTGRYSVHVLASLALGAVALVLSVGFGSIVALSVFLVSIAMMGALAYDGPFWASSSRAVPVALAGGAMGLINVLGNLGGFAERHRAPATAGGVMS
jgi:hypothetical protein